MNDTSGEPLISIVEHLDCSMEQAFTSNGSEVWQHYTGSVSDSTAVRFSWHCDRPREDHILSRKEP